MNGQKLNLGYVILIVTLAVCQTSVDGQDLDSLMQAIDKIGANLEVVGVNRVAPPQGPRHPGIENNQSLRSTPGDLDTSKCTQIERELQALWAEVAELRITLNTLKQKSNNPTTAQNDVVVLFEQLTILQAELELLRQGHQESAQLASTEPITALVPESPAEETSKRLEISGFFDVVGSSHRVDGDEAPFRLGQAEIDLANQVSNRIAVEAAVAYNNEAGTFELGAAFIDFHLLSRDKAERHTHTALDIDHSYILAGQFDVPFGVDYHTYASIDRKLVTAPAVVELTHGGWSDVGIQLGLETPHANLVGYWVNGFESSAEILDEVQTLATGVEVYEEINTTPANALGMRLGLKPLDWMELGGSFAAGWNASEKNEMTLAGLDLQLTYDKLEVKSALIGHSMNRTIAEENNRGFYLQALYNIFDRAFVVGRYGSFKPDRKEWSDEGSIGAGYSLADCLEVRWEASVNEALTGTRNFIQAVAAF